MRPIATWLDALTLHGFLSRRTLVSKKANPTIIGGFVLGAIAVVVAAVAVFGSGKFLTRHPRAVAFFQGNIQGLTVGSTVTLRGVEVGAVTAIEMNLDVKTMEPIIPVYMEFDPDRLKIPGGSFTKAELRTQEPLKLAIAKGLHARLATQSLVTGQLIVDLTLDPHEHRHFTGADPSTVEIPTTESDIDKLKKALAQLPLEQIATSALQLFEDTDRVVKSDQIPKLLTSLVSVSENLNALVADRREDLPKLVADFRELIRSTGETMASGKTALTTANQLLVGDVRDAVRVAIGTLQKADKVMANTDALIAPNSPERYDIDQTLRNLTATTRALRVFAEGLERRPNSLVVGK
jgi:paraquat-inducible protein B